MNTRWGLVLSLLAVLVLAAPGGWAHRMIPNDGTHTNADVAIQIQSLAVSQVAYQQIAAFSPQLWFTFMGESGEPLHVEVGVPKIDRLKDFRPAYAVLGPGLPEVDVPFAIPEGYGGWVFTTDDIANPEVFTEEFTGTTSWTFPPTDIVLPADGKYYVVAYAPSDEQGKLWMAVGTEEVFSVQDILSLPTTLLQVRRFHEVGPVGGIAGWILLFLPFLLLALLILIPMLLL